MKQDFGGAARLFLLLIISLLVSTRAWGANIISDWYMTTGNANYEPRGYAASISFNAKAYVIGGAITSVYLNDVWSSSNGIDWTAVTRNAEWTARDEHVALSYDGKMWVISGQIGADAQNDAWYSTNGAEWTAATRNAAFPGREGASGCIFDSKMWIMGGVDGATQFNDVWYSTDGIDWTAATRNAEWSTRLLPSVLVYDNKMWVIGGTTIALVKNDVYYSTDGVEWTSVGAADWGARGYQQGFVLDNKMWIVGGLQGTTYLRDVWRSTDGDTWTEDLTGEFSGRQSFNSLVMGSKVIISNGYETGTVLKNDVWLSRLAVATSTPTITKTTYVTRTKTPTASVTQTNSSTATRTSTRTPSFTVTKTGTITITRTPTYTKTVTQTNTPIVTFTNTQTITTTHTFSPTYTPTDTITETWTVSETHTFSPTSTVTMTPTPIETIIAWLSSIDADNFKSDIMISWRQYPDTTDNPVNYAVYYIAINRATDYAHVINVVNADDYNPSSDVFSYVLQGIPHGDLISVTVTAKGGDLGVSEMSNNFTAVSIPTPDLTPRQMFNINTIESVKTPVVVTVKDGADALDIGSDGEITSIGFFHKEQHKCESFYWSMSRTVGTGTDYFGFVVPQGKTLHARMDLTALDGVIQARLFNVPFGAAGITFTGKNFCYGIANAPTPEVKAYEKVNTLTACSEANAVSSRRTAGTMTGGTPSGGKVGSTSSEGDADWAILGTGDYVLRLIGLVASDSYDMTFYDYKHGADE